MADVFSKSKRSEVMSRIRAQGNKATELALISFLRLYGITGWRRRQPLFGKPDFVFRKQKVAVFVDGCFWHGCPTHGTRPKSNAAFWNDKIHRNINRDRLVNATLRAEGWRVLRIWEHDLLKKKRKASEDEAAKVFHKPRLEAAQHDASQQPNQRILHDHQTHGTALSTRCKQANISNLLSATTPTQNLNPRPP